MNFSTKKMDRLVVFALALCLYLGLAACDDQWSREKTLMLRKDREEATRHLVNDLVMTLLGRYDPQFRAENGVDKKSGWRSLGLPIQTRFAAFGSKLMPSREGGDHGSTLLRYGRST